MNPLSKPVPNDDRVKEAFAVLEKAFEEDLPRIQENQFRETILPLILSKEPPKSFEAWLRVSDSVLRPIAVYQGQNFLFKCPAIGRPVNFGIARNPRDSMFEHISKAMQKDDMIPMLGQRYIQNALVQRVEGRRLYDREVLEWQKVFKFYGLTSLSADAADAEPGKMPTAKAIPVQSEGFLSDDYDLA
jgi:hypothetical protein